MKSRNRQFFPIQKPIQKLGLLVCLGVLSAGSAIPCIAQVQGTGVQGQAAQDQLAQPQQTPASADGQSHATNGALQKKKDQLTADTAKLLQLANELKAEMDKSTKDTLSLSVIKKADEVEKLAHKVRDEMRATIGN